MAKVAAEKRMPIETEPEKWVSPTGSAVTSLEALRSEIGFSTELGVMVQAPDVTSDEVVAWIHRFETIELQRHPNELLQVASAPGVAADVVGITPSGADVRALIVDANNPDILYLGTSGGEVYVSYDGAKSWVTPRKTFSRAADRNRICLCAIRNTSSDAIDGAC